MFCCSKKKVQKIGQKYSVLSNQIKPFDLIVFRGSDIVSDTISFVENQMLGCGEWTHVGMIVTTDIMPIKNGVKDRLYILESTMSGSLGDGVNDIEKNKGTFGVQIRDFEDVVNKYDKHPDTRIGWCKLIKNPYDNKDDLNRLKELCHIWYTRYIGITYDYNPCNLFSTVIPCLCNSNSTNKMFCSELVTSFYQILGLLPKEIKCEHIAPQELLGWTNNSNLPCIVEVPPVLIIRN